MAAACITEGTVAAALAAKAGAAVTVEHPSGSIELQVNADRGPDGQMKIGSVGLVRTARPIFDGSVFVRHASRTAQNGTRRAA